MWAASGTYAKKLALEDLLALVGIRVNELLADVGELDVAALDFDEMQHLQGIRNREQIVALHVQFVGDDRQIGFAVVRLAGERLEKAGQKIGGNARQNQC